MSLTYFETDTKKTDTRKSPIPIQQLLIKIDFSNCNTMIHLLLLFVVSVASLHIEAFVDVTAARTTNPEYCLLNQHNDPSGVLSFKAATVNVGPYFSVHLFNNAQHEQLLNKSFAPEYQSFGCWAGSGSIPGKCSIGIDLNFTDVPNAPYWIIIMGHGAVPVELDLYIDFNDSPQQPLTPSTPPPIDQTCKSSYVQLAMISIFAAIFGIFIGIIATRIFTGYLTRRDHHHQQLVINDV